MRMAETLREQSITNRQKLDQIRVDSIVRSITEHAKTAAEKGERTTEVSSSSLEELHLQERVKEILEAEGFTVKFYTLHETSLSADKAPTHHVSITW